MSLRNVFLVDVLHTKPVNLIQFIASVFCVLIKRITICENQINSTSVELGLALKNTLAGIFIFSSQIMVADTTSTMPKPSS